jgi:hypothetical protein
LRNGLDRLVQKARFGGLFVLLALFAGQALAQDYEREKRWSDSIVKTLMIGSAEWLQQKNGHRFLALYTEAEKPRGAVIVAHGRGWSPDFELYGTLRTRLAELGYTTLSIQLPVLPITAILGALCPALSRSRERLPARGRLPQGEGPQDIGSSRTASARTMANQYLIRTEDKSVGAWVS